MFFEERGGLVKLPPEKDILLRKYRDSFYDLHSAYSRYMLLLYNTIGSPDYNQVLLSGLKRSGLSGNPEAFFSRMLSRATVEECICYLVYLQRMDYASGGTSHNHLKACVSGEVVRILDHMDKLLSKPVSIG